MKKINEMSFGRIAWMSLLAVLAVIFPKSGFHVRLLSIFACEKNFIFFEMDVRFAVFLRLICENSFFKYEP